MAECAEEGFVRRRGERQAKSGMDSGGNERMASMVGHDSEFLDLLQAAEDLLRLDGHWRSMQRQLDDC